MLCLLARICVCVQMDKQNEMLTMGVSPGGCVRQLKNSEQQQQQTIPDQETATVENM